MLNRAYMIVGGLLVAGLAWTSWSGTEFGTRRYALPIAGRGLVHAGQGGHPHSRSYFYSTGRSGWGLFGGK